MGRFSGYEFGPSFRYRRYIGSFSDFQFTVTNAFSDQLRGLQDPSAQSPAMRFTVTAGCHSERKPRLEAPEDSEPHVAIVGLLDDLQFRRLLHLASRTKGLRYAKRRLKKGYAADGIRS